jgi:threonine dehydrogenase-like Zn-dependent dehydrogenase
MTEPVSCCLHGIDLCEIQCGSTVAVIGCGMIGLIMLQLAKLRGAARLIAVEPVAEKRQQALDLGADLALDPMGDWEAQLQQAGITRIDTVIECAGRTDTMEMAIRMAGNKSLVMLFGLTAPNDTISVKPFEIFKKEITIKASFINPYTFSRALKLIESGKVDVTSMVYRTAPLSELPEILADGEKRRGGKIIIHP